MPIPLTDPVEIAQEVVRRTIAALPAPLKASASQLPVSFEQAPGGPGLADMDDPDLLGLFVGPPLAEPESSPLPPQIILFVENLWDFADADEAIFRREVRTTYLHELGHYLGLDEVDLEQRGLE